jgi:hypothetical protein
VEYTEKQQEALDKIGELLAEARRTKVDRWPEALEVAEAAGLDIGESAELFADAIKPDKEEPKVIKLEPKVEAGAEPKVTGLPVVLPVNPVPVSRDERLLEALNREHAVIANFGGKGVIASYDPSTGDPGKREWAFQSVEAFALRYSNRYVTIELFGKVSSVNLGRWWINHEDRRQYRAVTFQPNCGETIGECFNLWRGWGCKAVKGDWRLIREHIEEVICRGNKIYSGYVVKWIAWAIQNPGRQPEVALVLIGLKGSGKGTLARALERIFGVHAYQVTDREGVIGQFNGHLQDCILFVADEAYWGGDKRCVGRLQGMITEPKLSIERKGVDRFSVPNMLHIMMLAEPGWVIPAGPFERRYGAIEVSDRKRGDKGYFKALHSEIAGGGAEAMFWDLREMELGDWHPRELPDELLHGAALQRQQRLTLPPVEQWWLTILNEGRLPGRWQLVYPCRAYTDDLMSSARESSPKLRYDLSEIALAAFLKDEVGCRQARSGAQNGWSFPPLGECRGRWVKRYGPVSWVGEEWKSSKLKSKGLDIEELKEKVAAATKVAEEKKDVEEKKVFVRRV